MNFKNVLISRKKVMCFLISACVSISLSASLFAQSNASNSAVFDAPLSSLKITSCSQNMKVNTDGTLVIGDSNEVPNIYGTAKKFGMYISDVIKPNNDFQSAIIDINTLNFDKSDTIKIEARASKDNIIWSEWNHPVDENSNEISFYDAYKFIQYRIISVVFSDKKPVIKNVSLKLRSLNTDEYKLYSQKIHSDGITVEKMQKPVVKNDLTSKRVIHINPATGKVVPNNSVSANVVLNNSLTASTVLNNSVTVSTVPNPYTMACFASQEGCLGGTTANGHTITATDVFVALPSWKCLNSNGGTAYTVDITYNGTTVTDIPVWDVGPFNENDDFWNYNYIGPYNARLRDNWGYEGYGDLSRGWSEEWSAKNNNFHNGWTSSHYISGKTKYQSDTNPGSQVHNSKSNPNYPNNTLHNNGAEIDLSDCLHNTLLGIPNLANVTVSVKFNWVYE